MPCAPVAGTYAGSVCAGSVCAAPTYYPTYDVDPYYACAPPLYAPHPPYPPHLYAPRLHAPACDPRCAPPPSCPAWYA